VKSRAAKYRRTPLIRIANYLDRLGPSVKLVENSTKLTLMTVYRVQQEERTRIREGVPYVKLYRQTPKHLYPKFNG